MTKSEIAQADIMIARPIMPEKIILRASVTFSSLPPAVIHLNPPAKTITTAIKPNMPKRTLIRLAAVSRRSWLPSLPTTLFPTGLRPNVSLVQTFGTLILSQVLPSPQSSVVVHGLFSQKRLPSQISVQVFPVLQSASISQVLANVVVGVIKNPKKIAAINNKPIFFVFIDIDSF